MTQTGIVKYCCDANGNVLSGGSANALISYTPYGLPLEVKSLTNNRKVRYEYGPNREKIRRLNSSNTMSTSTVDVLHYVGSAEVHWKPGRLMEVRRYASPLLVVQSAKATGQDYRIERQYLVTDALGSTFAVLTDWGQPVNTGASMSFEPSVRVARRRWVTPRYGTTCWSRAWTRARSTASRTTSSWTRSV